MALVFNCMLYCYWSQLEIAIAIVDCAADFFNATKRLIILSVFYFVISFLVFLFAMAASVYVYSMSDFKFNNDLPFNGHFLG